MAELSSLKEWVRWPAAIESCYISLLGSWQTDLLTYRTKCRFMWCRIMFFLLGQSLWAEADEICSASYVLWDVLAWTKPHCCAFLEKESAILFLRALNLAASCFQFVARNSGWSKVQQQQGQKGENHSAPWRELGYLPRSSTFFL